MERKRRKKVEVLPQKIVTELAAIGLTRATDVLQLRDGEVCLKSEQDMGKHHAAAIAGVEKTSGGWKIKFYDKLKALELLGEYLGMFGTGAGQRQQEACNLLEAILASTQEEVNISDLQELQQTADVGDDLVEQTPV